MKTMKKWKIFIPMACILCVFLFTCENQWMTDVLQEKTITFDSNGGTPVPSQKLLQGERVTRPADPVKPGFIFRGWYKDNWTFNELYDFDFIPLYSMILYAGWNDIETSDPNKRTPTLTDFDIQGVGIFAYSGSNETNQKKVIVTPRLGKTDGTITVFYEGFIVATGINYSSDIPPTDPGKYSVTFDVTQTTEWNGVVGLYAGELEIQIRNANGFGIYLGKLGTNTPTNPHNIELYINDSLDNVSVFREIAEILVNINKYVYLDFSGSTITSFPDIDSDSGSGYGYHGCNYLIGVNIPESVSSIGLDSQIFIGQMDNLTSIDVVENNPYYSSVGGVLYNKSKNTLYIYPQGKTITNEYFSIPSSVTTIYRFAFSFCNKLKSVTITESVSSIGERAFSPCLSLAKVEFKKANINIYDVNVFDGDLYSKYINQTGGIGTYNKTYDYNIDDWIWTKGT